MSKDSKKNKTKSLNESIGKLESELSVAKIEGNARKIMSLEKIIQNLKSKLTSKGS